MGRYKYLIKVEPNANNNKFYKMIENSSDFEVQFGRVGSSYQTKIYPINKWDSLLRSKLAKGYEDKTELVAKITIEKEKNGYKNISDSDIMEIVNKLQSYARKSVKENYTVSSSSVTKSMVQDAQSKIDYLVTNIDSLSVVEFNERLVALFKTIPRKMSNVSDYLAKDKKDFGKITEKEQSLLDVMMGQVVEDVVETEEQTSSSEEKTILDALGIRFERITREEEDMIKKNLGSISDKFNKAWKVENLKTDEKYNNFLSENKISERKFLFHGTRSENVWSILNSGLLLRPQAVINGKMFGNGIYFAPLAKKSLGYTSLSGSYWAKGGNNEGYMLLFDVAYGTPYDTDNFNSKYYNLNYDELQKLKRGANCLHAHAEKGFLQNDEIIIYKEEQATVKYLIQLK